MEEKFVKIILTKSSVDDAGVTSFIKALANECNTHEITPILTVADTEEAFDEIIYDCEDEMPVLIPEPCDYEYSRYDYDFYNADSDATAEVITKECVKHYLYSLEHVVIVGTGPLGTALANMLMAERKTVSVIGRGTSVFLRKRILDEAQIVIYATPWQKEMNDRLSGKVVFDPANAYWDKEKKKAKDCYFYMGYKEIGKKTVEQICDNVIEYYEGDEEDYENN